MRYRFYIAIISTLFVASCAEDSLPGQKKNNTNGNGNQFGYDSGRFNGQRSDQQFGNGSDEKFQQGQVISKDSFPSFRFITQAPSEVEHRSGRILAQQTITIKIDAEVQTTVMDAMFAYSGDYTKQFNENIIGGGNASHVTIKNGRVTKEELEQAKQDSDFSYYRAFIFAKSMSKENTFKNQTWSWNANRPFPVQIRPGSCETYRDLREDGSFTYVTQLSGNDNVTLRTTVSVESLSDTEARIKMKNTVPSDSTGSIMDLMPLADEVTYVMDCANKETKSINAISHYVDSSNGNKYRQSMNYKICAKKENGEIQVYGNGCTH